MINKLKTVLEYISNMNKNFLMAIVTILIVVFAFGYVSNLKADNRKLETELVVQENNYKTKIEDISTSYNKKNKEYEMVKGSLIKTREDYKKDTTELGKEIGKLSKNSQYYLKVIAELKGEIGILENSITVVSDSSIKSDWGLDVVEEGYEQHIYGYSELEYEILKDSIRKGNPYYIDILKSKSILTKNNTKFSLSFNHEEYTNEDGKKQWKVVAKTPNSRLKLDDISSVYFIDKQVEIIKEKSNPWSFGPSVSYGMNADGSLGLNVGVSLQYNLFTLFNK